MKKFQIILAVLFLSLQLSCTKDDLQESIVFGFTGTYNDQPFSFSNNQIILEKGKIFATDQTTYGQRSVFGNPVSQSKGILFGFSFGESRPTYDWVKTFDGQQLLDAETEEPSLRITIFNEGEIVRSNYGLNSDDVCRIDVVKLIKRQEVLSSDLKTDKVIVVKGYIKILDGSTKLEGNFTLKLLDIKY
ncbi:MAG: hypothetical protein SFV55_12460 [Haliscomenobacter sp.]|uniref:hypothetical protein n=1 Tax=Haliscomenobacter sp. TaxID=2717303 RepID=UPI0029BAE048|nr:hypothetical protein [Haliscomenobacter sp.]MDX2069228.1 hypothetical protein [Haliscomenobacter sp.]